MQNICSRSTRQTSRLVVILLSALVICLAYRKKLKLASKSPHKFTDPCPDSFPANFYSNISKSASKTLPLEPKLRDWCFKSHTPTCDSTYSMENDTVYLDYPPNSCTYRPIKYQWDNAGPKIDSAWYGRFYITSSYQLVVNLSSNETGFFKLLFLSIFRRIKHEV